MAVAGLVAALIAGCSQLSELFTPSAPQVSEEWPARLEEIRAFERRIGFRETDNFVDLSREHAEFPYCGYTSRFHLPYSYEDPAIGWLESLTEQECRQAGGDADVFFGTVEALGEVGTPMTPAMVTGKLDRFLYLVIHEDCHDQFELPYGIEEALCELITYKAMAAFSAENFAWYARENRAIRRYADEQSKLTRATIGYYEQLETLYSRYQRNEIPADVLLRERAALFDKAERALVWTRGEMNNVGLANDMTYSRHYPFLESVFDALGRDLARTVAFFRRVDEIKPSAAAVMKRRGIPTKKSVEFVRANEAAVVETVRKLLSSQPNRGSESDSLDAGR